MSFIQTIRDKAAWIIIGAIALALIAFIVQDALQGGGSGWFGGQSTVIGKVNGEKIGAADFDRRYKQVEENYASQGYPLNDQFRSQIRESLWNDYVERAILEDEYKELGIGTISDKELSDILYGPNPPQELRQQFTDSSGYNATAAYNAIRALKSGSAQYNSFWGEFVPTLENNRRREKFTALIANSSYVPKWLIEKTNAENSQVAAISYVNVPYSTIPDSSITITNDDVQQYINARKDQFKQEEARTAQYVTFDAAPSKKDSTELYDQLNNLKEQMATTTDVKNFLVTNSSETPLYDGFVLGSKMQMANADTLRKLTEGQVYGPYLDAGNYVVAKMVAKRNMPDSAKVRHILIKIADQQNGQIRTDSAANKLIDSIITALKSGTPFDTLVVKFSEDEGSKNNKGEYDFSSTQTNLSKEFYDVTFYGNAGDKKKVKVENQSYSGYHYIEVINHRKVETAYKIAYLSRPITASNETVNAASGLASQFTAESRNSQQFDANAKKRNLNVFTAADISPLASDILGLGESRELVRWMYKDAKVGQVAERPFLVGDKYVVPVLVRIYEKGTMPVEKAKPLVEYKIRNEKKAAQIIQKLGNITTLDLVAKTTGQQVQRIDSVLFSANFIPNIGQELRVVGASFNKNNQTKPSAPIKGEVGVFVLKVESIGALPNPSIDVKLQQQAMQQQQKQMATFRVIDALKKSASIIDNRADFY